MLSINLSKVRIKQIIDASYKSKPTTTNHNRKELMNKPNPKNLTQWIVTAVFLVLVVGFSLLDQQAVKAQTLTPSITTESELAPVISPVTSPMESVTSPVISPVALPMQSVAANVRRLLQTNECAGCNLTGAMLKDTNLQAANLEGANLQDADLERANLQQTNLQGANFQGADLGKVNLLGANLSGANLFDADLEKANLLGANLQTANLQGADLEKTNLTNANIQGVNLMGVDLEDAIRPEGFTVQ